MSEQIPDWARDLTEGDPAKRGPGRPRKVQPEVAPPSRPIGIYNLSMFEPSKSEAAELTLRDIWFRLVWMFDFRTGPSEARHSRDGAPTDYAPIEAGLRDELDAWRSRWESSVNVEQVLREVFRSVPSMSWNPSAEDIALAQKFAGVQS